MLLSVCEQCYTINSIDIELSNWKCEVKQLLWTDRKHTIPLKKNNNRQTMNHSTEKKQPTYHEQFPWKKQPTHHEPLHWKKQQTHHEPLCWKNNRHTMNHSAEEKKQPTHHELLRWKKKKQPTHHEPLPWNTSKSKSKLTIEKWHLGQVWQYFF